MRPESLDEVQRLYEGAIKEVYQAAEGFRSAYLLVDRATGEAWKRHR